MFARRSLSVLALGLIAASLVACGREPREKLQGSWEGIAIDGLTPEQTAKADGWAKGTKLQFIGNKVTVAMPAESPRTGTFRVAQADGDRIRVQFKRPEGGEDLAEFRFADDGTLRWHLGDAEVVMMKTKKN